MKCPQIEYGGSSLNVKEMRWGKEDVLESVSFYDVQGKYQTAFQLKPNVYLDKGVIYLNLNNCVTM